ncbi:MAG: hypothetical protein H6843_08925 [Rhodospirillaceae bacterium]|nr:hypothetical protein [Rhodospirillaceae bacterium]
MSYDGKNNRNKSGSDTLENRSLGDSFDLPARPIMTIDLEKYQSLLDDPRLSDEHKEEFLEALWSIVVAFVELGFGVHPLQEVCEQNQPTDEKTSKDAFDLVRSEESESDKTSTDLGPPGGLEAK